MCGVDTQQVALSLSCLLGQSGIKPAEWPMPQALSECSSTQQG